MYYFAGAGLVPRQFNAHLYVKFGNFGKVIEVKEYKEQDYVEIFAIDRKITVFKKSSPKELEIDYDYYFSVNPYEFNSIAGKQNKFGLFSAHNAENLANKDRDSWCTNKDIKIIVDSGGFQLVAGTSRYVDPKKVIKCYNACADFGIALDIPPRYVDWGNRDILDAMILAQLKNNKIFSEHKSPDLKLLNVAHGITLEEIRYWAKKVYNKNFYGWAMPADNRAVKITSIRAVLVGLLEMPKENSQHFHILGVSAKTWMPALAWLGKYTKLTSDGSNHIHTAIRARLMEVFSPDGKITQYRMGDTPLRKSGTDRIDVDIIDYEHESILPCSCPICHSVKFTKIYKFSNYTKMPTLLSIHNLHTNQNYAAYWNRLAKTLSVKEFIAKIEKHIKNQEIVQAVEYIEYAMKHGLDKAEKQFYQVLNFNPPSKITEEALFPEALDEQGEESGLSMVKWCLPNYLTFEEMSKLDITKAEYDFCKAETEKEKKVGFRRGKNSSYANFQK